MSNSGLSLLDELCMSTFGVLADQITDDTQPLVPKKKKQKTAKKKPLRRDSYVPPKFKPNLFQDSPCCKGRRCSEYFLQRQIDAWRALRLRMDLKVHDMQSQAMMLWDTMLVPNGDKCCGQFFMWVFGFSNNTLYYQRMGGVVTRRRDASRVDASVMGWFLNLREMLDCMPDKDVYQISAPLKRDVYRWSVSCFLPHLRVLCGNLGLYVGTWKTQKQPEYF